MKYRLLGKTGYEVSEVSLGTWQVGGRWGEEFDEKSAEDILNRAIDLGVNFFDTADVYSGGMSEKMIGKVLKSRSERIIVATKCGRRLSEHTADGYNKKNIIKFVEDSLRNLRSETIDLLQLHCPPTEVYSKDEVFLALDDLKRQGKILHAGVSVEKVEEALKAIEYDCVETVQIIFNIFRQKPIDEFFQKAREKNTGIIARVPLASGLLTGKLNKETKFGRNDHRTYNRKGEAFDKGETFSGVDYETGLMAVEEIKQLFDGGYGLYLYALKWILMFEEIGCVIPGASSRVQVEDNVKATDLEALTREQMTSIKEIYDKYIKDNVHDLW